MGIKLGGYVCDVCKKIIGSLSEKPLYWRKTKKGNIMHFCGPECSMKDSANRYKK